MKRALVVVCVVLLVGALCVASKPLPKERRSPFAHLRSFSSFKPYFNSLERAYMTKRNVERQDNQTCDFKCANVGESCTPEGSVACSKSQCFFDTCMPYPGLGGKCDATFDYINRCTPFNQQGVHPEELIEQGCALTPSGSGICNAVHYLQTGSPCQADYQCQLPLICDSGFCSPSYQLGQKCSNDEECVGSLYCNDHFVCAPRQEAGQSCSSSQSCKPWNVCETFGTDNGTCQPVFSVPEGGQCDDLLRCNPGLVCNTFNYLCEKPSGMWGKVCNNESDCLDEFEPLCMCDPASPGVRRCLRQSDFTFSSACASKLKTFLHCNDANNCKDDALSCSLKKCRAEICAAMQCIQPDVAMNYYTMYPKLPCFVEQMPFPPVIC